jgi:hypothetical protein
MSDVHPRFRDDVCIEGTNGFAARFRRVDVPTSDEPHTTFLHPFRPRRLLFLRWHYVGEHWALVKGSKASLARIR